MKKIILFLLIFNQTAMANCNWKNIKEVDSGYLYPNECHRAVGILKKTKELQEEESKELKNQIEDLKSSKFKLSESLEIKDLALQKADQEAMRWREESYKQHERLLKHDRLSSRNNWIYVGVGFLAASLSVYAASQLNR